MGGDFDLIIRHHGGDNAGHTIVNEHGVFHMRSIPSGIFNHNAACLIGTGTVVNPETLLFEIDTLARQGICLDNLQISSKAHILMPYHIALDVANEEKHGIIDTTKCGIGPAYADRALRDNLRFEDLNDSDAINRYFANVIPRINNALAFYNQPIIDSSKLERKIEFWRESFLSRLVEPISLVHKHLENNKSILLEGQLGLQRDIDLGQYPYVTSSHPVAAYACVSTGIPISKISNVLGIARAYPILAGNGPFPTEMDESIAGILRGNGEHVDDEFGVNTRRPRRIGWPDIPLLKYSHQINGYTELALCKLDKFDAFEKIKICRAYLLDNEIIHYYPSTAEMRRILPQYVTIDGWSTSTRHIRKISGLPYNARVYIDIIERSLGVPIKYIGVGPHKHDIIVNH
jgi:adenylosuccinate synthase